MLNKLHLNNVHCTQGGMYLTGLKTGGMLLFNGREVQMAVELPPGTHNARPFRDGVLFNDTEANAAALRRRGEGREDRAMSVPRYPDESLLNRDLDQSGDRAPGLRARARRALGHAGGRRLVAVHGLGLRPAANERVLSVNLTMDVRNAIHGLEVWPFD